MVEVADGVTNLCCWVEAEGLRRAGGTPHRFLASALTRKFAPAFTIAGRRTGWHRVDDHQFHVWEDRRPGRVRHLEHR